MLESQNNKPEDIGKAFEKST